MFRLNKNGFTLLELIIVLAIFMMAVFGAVQTFMVSFKASRNVNDQLLAQKQGRRAVQDFINEVRAASYSSVGGYPLQKASSTEVIFYSNIDEDNYIERIRYYLADKKLVKGITKPSGSPLVYTGETTSTIVEGIYNLSMPVFYYYDQYYNGISSTAMTYPVNLTNVKVLKMNLKIDHNPAESPTSLSVQGEAEMRNLKSN